MKTGKGDIAAQKARYKAKHPEMIRAQKARYRERHKTQKAIEDGQIYQETDWDKFRDYLNLKSQYRRGFARELHIPENTLYSWLSGRRHPSSQAFHKLADLEGVAYEDFVKKFKRVS